MSEVAEVVVADVAVVVGGVEAVVDSVGVDVGVGEIAAVGGVVAVVEKEVTRQTHCE